MSFSFVLTALFDLFPRLFLRFLLNLAKLSTWSHYQFLPEPQLTQEPSLVLLIQVRALARLFSFGYLLIALIPSRLHWMGKRKKTVNKNPLPPNLTVTWHTLKPNKQSEVKLVNYLGRSFTKSSSKLSMCVSLMKKTFHWFPIVVTLLCFVYLNWILPLRIYWNWLTYCYFLSSSDTVFNNFYSFFKDYQQSML